MRGLNGRKRTSLWRDAATQREREEIDALDAQIDALTAKRRNLATRYTSRILMRKRRAALAGRAGGGEAGE